MGDSSSQVERLTSCPHCGSSDGISFIDHGAAIEYTIDFRDGLREHAMTHHTRPVPVFGKCLSCNKQIRIDRVEIDRQSAPEPLDHVEAARAALDLDRVRARLLELYSEEEAEEWLNSSHPQLKGGQPMTAIISGQTNAVMAILDRLDAGAYL